VEGGGWWSSNVIWAYEASGRNKIGVFIMNYAVYLE